MIEFVQKALVALGIVDLTVKEVDDAFRIYSDGEEIGRFRMKELPGCNAAVVFHRAWVPENRRGQGHGKTLHKIRLAAAAAAGYSLAICTVVTANAAQNAILTEFGWKPERVWDNPKTGNKVCLWSRGL